MDFSLPHIASRIFETPLMIARHKAEAIVSVLTPRLLDNEVKFKALLEDDRKRKKNFQMVGNMAIIPVQGTLVHRTTGMDALSGLLSYERISTQLDEALNDPDVARIVLDINSPGGEVAGVFDLSDRLFNLRGEKPISAIVDEQSFSGAYAIASAADEIIIPRTGSVGSVGVIAMLVSQKRFNEDMGIDVKTIFAGDRKNDLNPHEEIKDEAVATVQSHVNEIYNLFVETVARNRGMTTEAVRETKAGLFMGQAALKAGLADRIEPVQSAFNELMNQTAGRFQMAAPKGETPKEEDHIESNVVDFKAELDQARQKAQAEAKQLAQERARAVNDLCILAGMPHLAGELIASGKEVEEVRSHLCALKVKADEETAVSGVQKTEIGMDVQQTWATAFAKVGK